MTTSPFHADELRAQALAGVETPPALGIRSFMPEQHRAFFPLLPYLFIGVPDAAGWPLATVLTGAPGFVHTPDPVTLRIEALPVPDDPAFASFVAGGEIGLLGLDLSTRRRNRANGRIAGIDAEGFTVDVAQSFGNCPQYIQQRRVEAAAHRGAASLEILAALDDAARRTIAAADTFFVASRAHAGDSTGGADISHRGGKPGFIAVDGDTLAIPDYRGNRFFNTLGNLIADPRAGLLFIDFDTGDVLQLQGTVEIAWHDDARVSGADRAWRFRTTRGWRRRAALPLRWTFASYAPELARTGAA